MRGRSLAFVYRRSPHMSPSRVPAPGAAFTLVVLIASTFTTFAWADPPQTLWEELNAPYASTSTGAYDPIHHEMLVLVPSVLGRTEMWTYDLDAPSHWHHELPYNSSVTI